MTELKKDNDPALKGETVVSRASAADPQAVSGVTLALGEQIAGRYRVIELLGKGGMGSVYKVEDLKDHKQLALKTLNPGNLSELAWKRFGKEARAAGLLDHPVLIKVHDIGLIKEEQPFFVMDYFEGETLAQRIRRDGPLTLDAALPIFLQACFALGHAHNKGVIHRDIKPSNIMVSKLDAEPPEVRIVDFGLAKLVTAAEVESVALTQTGEIFGTPYYMSPEQCLGTSIDTRSDIYSLGCVMFECLTGTPPFLGDTALSTMMKHQSEPAPTLTEASLGKEFPEGIELLVAKLLSKDPAERYQNLFDVANDLTRISRGLRPEASPTLTAQVIPAKVERGIMRGVIALAIVAVALGAFIAGRLTAPASKVESARSAGVPEGLPTIHSFGETKSDRTAYPPLNEMDGMADQLTKLNLGDHFSTMSPPNSTTRMFRFPGKEESLGNIMVPSSMKITRFYKGTLIPTQKVPSACGLLLMENFQPFGLQVSDYLLSEPHVLQFFRNDELSTLYMVNGLARDDVFPYIAKLPSIKVLNLRGSRYLHDKCIAYLNDLPQLSELTISETQLTTEPLLHLKRLRQLRVLRVKETDGVPKLLQALRGDTAIELIDMRMNGLTEEQMAAVGDMPNLRILDISGDNRKDGIVPQLLRLRKLESLYAHGNHFSAEKNLSQLKKLTWLKRLTMTYKDEWTPQQVSELQRALPHCKITEEPDDSDRL